MDKPSAASPRGCRRDLQEERSRVDADWRGAFHGLLVSMQSKRSRSAARDSKRSATVACPLQRVVGHRISVPTPSTSSQPGLAGIANHVCAGCSNHISRLGIDDGFRIGAWPSIPGSYPIATISPCQSGVFTQSRRLPTGPAPHWIAAGEKSRLWPAGGLNAQALALGIPAFRYSATASSWFAALTVST